MKACPRLHRAATAPEYARQWLSWLARAATRMPMSRSIHFVNATPGEISNAPTAHSKDETQTAFLTGEFIRWLGEQDRPWFAHISFLRPHPPFSAPAPYSDMLSPADGPTFSRATDRCGEQALHPYLAYAMPRNRRGGEASSTARWWPGRRLERRRHRGDPRHLLWKIDRRGGRAARPIWPRSRFRRLGKHRHHLHVGSCGDGRRSLDLGKGGFFDGSYHIPLVIRDPRSADRGQTVEHSPAPPISFRCFASARTSSRKRPGRAVAATPSPRGGGRELAGCGLLGVRFSRYRSPACRFHWPAIERMQSRRHQGRIPGHVHFAGLAPLFDLGNDPMELRNVVPTRRTRRRGSLMLKSCCRCAPATSTRLLAYTELTENGPVRHRP